MNQVDIIKWAFATDFCGAMISFLEVCLLLSFSVNCSWLENECNTKNKANPEIKTHLQIHVNLT